MESTKILLKLISQFNKVARNKVDIQKSILYLYTRGEKPETEIKNNTIKNGIPKKIKYLEINLTKNRKCLYTENCETVVRDIKEDLNKWRDILCSWV